MRRRLLLLMVLAALPFLTPYASLGLAPVQEAALPYQYRLAQWEAANFLGKWWHQAWQRFFGPSLSREELIREEERFFRLGEEERSLLDQRLRLAAEGRRPSEPQLQRVEEELARVRRERAALRPAVEEFLESELSSVLWEQGTLLEAGAFRLQFPPVDFRFDTPPRLLVTSPRDRIERLDSLLLRPTMTVAEMEGLERRILTFQNLSALVEGAGGVATYPAVIPGGNSLRAALQAAAHEWLHHYLFFKPLGRQYWRGETLLTLNETVADLAGRELGDLAYVRLGGTIPKVEEQPGEGEKGEDPGAFVFEREMHQTRLRVDDLLAEGKVKEAEAYMEERRRFFLGQGVYIRKLNQAYFAFHGSYGDSPASTSPVGDEMEELRATFSSVGQFVRAVAGVSSYEEFQALLQERRALRQRGQ